MIKRIIHTTNDYSLLVLRFASGFVLLAHGVQKVFGWFDGLGWNNSINYFTITVGLPYALAVLVLLIETLGALSLIIGFASRINAALMTIVMTGAFFVDHLANGFYMNWFGTQKGEGFEFDILFWSINIVIIIRGGGAFSVDGFLMNKAEPSTQYNPDTKNLRKQEQYINELQ